jgi:aspartoacylase
MTYLVSESRGSAPAGGGPAAAGSADDYPYLSEIAPHGIEIEVGPVPQGVVRAETVILTERILNAIIDALDRYNRDEEANLPRSIVAYRYETSVDFPRDAAGHAIAMVHPELQDRDFAPLEAGDPLFLHLDGSTIGYDGEAGLVPVFVNEAAYYEKHAALTLCREVTIPVTA